MLVNFSQETCTGILHKKIAVETKRSATSRHSQSISHTITMYTTHTTWHSRPTLAASGFRQVAKICFGGCGNCVSCFTNSRPIPRFAPVMKSEPTLNPLPDIMNYNQLYYLLHPHDDDLSSPVAEWMNVDKIGNKLVFWVF